MIDRGDLDTLTLRFLDDQLEERFQLEEGAVGLAGYRTIALATVAGWLLAAALLPLGTDIDPRLALAVGGVMSLAGVVGLLASRWAITMDRQDAMTSVLTSANGVVILLLADAIGVIEGYAVAAIMLLFVFSTVSRTRFVFAAIRTVVIGIGLVVAVTLYDGEGSLVIDSFIFVAAGIGNLIGLRLIEKNRRREWHQRLVIEEQSAVVAAERTRSDQLLLNVLPASVSKRLKDGESPIADTFPEVSVLFADIVGFTRLAATMSSDQVIMLLSDLFSTFDDLVAERGLEKIKTIGDAYMAVGGIEPHSGHAPRVVDLALAMLASTVGNPRFPGVELRVGVHSGPASGGVIGSRKFAYDVWGDTVNVASRLEETGIPGRIQVSEQTRSLADQEFRFEARGPIEVKNVGVMQTFLVVGALESA